ncbi:F-box domain-containing protein [Favolaschia claudopus]|uniref:F-box domain-containing protein n=1 Tax=Favolaschia claudopus TaxID=2862362 RepID=A0AAW0AN79_9AGAR
MLDFMEADRVFVAEKDAQICHLQAQISELEKAISFLRAERQLAFERLSSYKYPVLTLPTEVTCEVFIRFLPLCPDFPPLVGLLSPINFTHICRQWREIALTTPDLWRSINLTRSSLQGHTHAEVLVPLWLERSGCLPLRIRAADVESESAPILPHIIPHYARLEHLTLSLNDAEPLAAMKASMPLLCSLNLWFGVRASDLIIFPHVPLLRTVILSDYGSPSIHLPWVQLTSLSLECIYANRAMHILRQTAHLVHCGLHFWPMEDDELHDDLSDVTLPRLESLVMDRDSARDMDFFRAIVTPALLSLEISEQFLRSGSSPTKILETFISKSACQLRELKITNAVSGARPFLDAFPAIHVIRTTS